LQLVLLFETSLEISFEFLFEFSLFVPDLVSPIVIEFAALLSVSFLVVLVVAAVTNADPLPHGRQFGGCGHDNETCTNSEHQQKVREVEEKMESALGDGEEEVEEGEQGGGEGEGWGFRRG
jgi:hypothetical protein